MLLRPKATLREQSRYANRAATPTEPLRDEAFAKRGLRPQLPLKGNGLNL
ncbi:hypothetical protein [Moorena sp. SIO4A5]|nr:hypothetical protein [Moorena sp. SIO4A5]NEO24220.1 hypothetical protein [Moorena sp. SIO4A5]